MANKKTYKGKTVQEWSKESGVPEREVKKEITKHKIKPDKKNS